MLNLSLPQTFYGIISPYHYTDLKIKNRTWPSAAHYVYSQLVPPLEPNVPGINYFSSEINPLEIPREFIIQLSRYRDMLYTEGLRIAREYITSKYPEIKIVMREIYDKESDSIYEMYLFYKFLLSYSEKNLFMTVKKNSFRDFVNSREIEVLKLSSPSQKNIEDMSKNNKLPSTVIKMFNDPSHATEIFEQEIVNSHELGYLILQEVIIQKLNKPLPRKVLLELAEQEIKKIKVESISKLISGYTKKYMSGTIDETIKQEILNRIRDYILQPRQIIKQRQITESSNFEWVMGTTKYTSIQEFAARYVENKTPKFDDKFVAAVDHVFASLSLNQEFNQIISSTIPFKFSFDNNAGKKFHECWLDALDHYRNKNNDYFQKHYLSSSKILFEQWIISRNESLHEIGVIISRWVKDNIGIVQPVNSLFIKNICVALYKKENIIQIDNFTPKLWINFLHAQTRMWQNTNPSLVSVLDKVDKFIKRLLQSTIDDINPNNISELCYDILTRGKIKEITRIQDYGDIIEEEQLLGLNKNEIEFSNSITDNEDNLPQKIASNYENSMRQMRAQKYLNYNIIQFFSNL